MNPGKQKIEEAGAPKIHKQLLLRVNVKELHIKPLYNLTRQLIPGDCYIVGENDESLRDVTEDTAKKTSILSLCSERRFMWRIG